MYFMNNATSCNVCVFESRNKWEMAACFVVLSSSTASWVIPCEKHCMTSSRTFSPQNETCDTYKNLLQECIPLYYSQTHTYLEYWGAIQSTLCVYHVILEGRRMLKLVEMILLLLLFLDCDQVLHLQAFLEALILFS